MKLKFVVPLMAAGIVAGSATADFTGLKVVQKVQTIGDNELFICNVYANFDGTADRLLSIGFANIQTQSGENFSQHATADSETAPAGFLIPIFPDLINDTYVTIGVKNSDEAPSGIDGTTLDPDYSNTGNKISGGWFNNNPASGQGDAANYPDLKILIGQFVVKGDGSTGGVEGTLTVFWQGPGTGGQVVGTEASFKHVPAPGALALLGIAGLAARRRRRA